MRRELAAPAQGVPEACVVGSKLDGALDERQSLVESPLPRYVDHRKLVERLNELGIGVERLTRECLTRGNVVCGVPLLGVVEELLGVAVGRQRTPSTRRTASSSVKTRNEFVRTFPWPLTASATRVIVSSSGAWAMTT